MATTEIIRPVGQTVALSATASSTAAVTVSPSNNEVVNFASFLNTGAVAVAISVSPVSADAAVLPVAGTPANTFVLAAAMMRPVVYAVPTGSNGAFSVRAIGAGAGPSVVYVQPVGNQS